MPAPSIRAARESDIACLVAFDHVAATDAARRDLIAHGVRAGDAWVALVDGAALAFAVMKHDFFGQDFLELLYVHPDHRRRGLGTALVRQVESVCRTPKLFTSTNESNLPMQGLLQRLGYLPSGVINNLDEGDPEIVYVKRLEGA